jgi:hypothetical protein
MDASDERAAWDAAERHVKTTYVDTAHIVRHVPWHPTSAPATQIEPTPPLEIWMLDAERSAGQVITLIASRSPDGWSVVEKV